MTTRKPRKRVLKNYYAAQIGWFVVRTTSKRRAREIALDEFGYGTFNLRLATEDEVADYIHQRGSLVEDE